MPIAPITPPIQTPGYREDEPEDKIYEDAEVDLGEEPEEEFTIDAKTGAKITVDPDGGVTIDMNPNEKTKKKSDKFNANLADFLDDSELSLVASEVLQGIDNDIQSRRDWDTAYDKGIQLMGLKLEDASAEVSTTGSISKVYDPLLIEATVRYQSTAMSELLPASGPVKVRDDAVEVDAAREKLADDFEKDFNHYLTVIAKEYYPDTDQLLFNQGWSGMAFKKIFECPIRKRPCSDLVLAPDLIVSNDIIDLESASRITHRTYMSNALVRRLQKAKVYRQVDLGQAVEQPTQVEEKVAEVSNININTKLPTDNRHTIYECYVELDLPGYEEDIPLPYVVTIDKDSQQILSIRRNWQENDTDYIANCPFVKYGMIPALGFYDLGFVHLLGNTTRALTAILRMQLDAGQFSIFPGFLFAKQNGKQETNDIRISPGSGMAIDTGGMPINQVAMALPYPGPSQVLAALAEKTAEKGMRLGMATEVTVGEGRADVPVGTTMALIEQATKVMSAVHKRNHVAQQREFEKLRALFNKNPEALTKLAKKPARKWQLAEEFADLELVPASDPNVPSHTHRLMQANALVMLASQAPQTFDVRAVALRAMRTMGISDGETLLVPLPPPGAPPPPPPPELMLKMQEIDLKKQQMMLAAEQQAAHDHARLQQMEIDSINGRAERESREKLEALKMVAETQRQQAAFELEMQKHKNDLVSEHLKHDSTMLNEHNKGKMEIAKTMLDAKLDLHKHHTGILADREKTQMNLESKERESKKKERDSKKKPSK